MPPAARSKLKKLICSDLSQPFHRAAAVVGNKLNYLERKKKRIESYLEAQKNGETLTSFQQSALAKLGQVSSMLEDIRDVHDQLCNIRAKSARTQEQLENKSCAEKTQQDLAKIKEVLLIQYVLQNMRQDRVREDFLTGQNGAICLTENDLECLDEFYVEISLMNGMEDDVPPFQDQLQQSAEHLVALVNGKAKEINNTTYDKLKEIISAIQSCGYFDYLVEDPATQLILQQNTKIEPEVTVEEFSVAIEENIVNGYALQDPVTFPKGTSASYTSIDDVGSCELFSEQSNHSSENLFVCSVCQVKYSQRDQLARHMRTHSSKKLMCCTICETTFSRKKDLKLHMCIHTGEKPFCCEKCNARFTRKYYLDRHMFVHCNKKAFGCSVCKAEFASQGDLKSHMWKHTNRKSKSFCHPVSDASLALKTHMRSHVVKETFSCTVCSVEFTEKDLLDKHMLNHNNTTFSCPACRAKFSQKSQLGQHILTHL